VAGVRITHPDRLVYPEQGLTKRAVAEYVAAVSPWLLPHVAGRPLSVVRCPQGAGGACFYQKHATEGLPAVIHGVPVQESGRERLYVMVDDVEGLVSLVQFGALELHPWGSRADRLDRPDRIVLDLDPDPAVAWKDVVASAHALRADLESLGLVSFARTTGGKGLHVVLPIERRTGWDEAKELARGLAARLARSAPDRYVLTASKARRAGRIFVDWMRNARGATAIASYSMRARPGATVATPLRWEELDARLDPARFTVATVPRRLATLAADPWEGFASLRQALTRTVLERVRSDAPAGERASARRGGERRARASRKATSARSSAVRPRKASGAARRKSRASDPAS
jgi:bifunctional non-homologous end joining protein LigD